MKTRLKDSETQNAVDRVKASISPKIPCVNADAEGYCTRNGGGYICFNCTDYKPVTLDAPDANLPVLADKVTALTVRVDALAIPDGSPAEQANALHRDFLKSAVSAKVRAVQCGWVLSLQRERLGHGQWMAWVANNLDFTQRTCNNYITAFESTVGAYRAQQRRPLPLSEAPTMEEIAAATAGTNEKPLAALYRSTGVVEGDPNHGGAREGAGRKAAAAAAAAGDGLDMGDSATLMWMEAMKPFEANRAAFHSAARDLNPNVAARFLEELRMLERTLDERVRGAR